MFRVLCSVPTSGRVWRLSVHHLHLHRTCLRRIDFCNSLSPAAHLVRLAAASLHHIGVVEAEVCGGVRTPSVVMVDQAEVVQGEDDFLALFRLDQPRDRLGPTDAPRLFSYETRNVSGGGGQADVRRSSTLRRKCCGNWNSQHNHYSSTLHILHFITF